MTVKTDINWTELSDTHIIRQMGAYIKHTRQNQDKTQAQLAEKAGVHRWTIQQIESGESITLSSLIQVLRALDCLHVFKNFEVNEEISPLEYAKAKKDPKKRVRNKKTDAPPKQDSTW